MAAKSSRKTSSLGKLVLLISMICVLGGVGILSYQIWHSWLGQQRTEQEVSSFHGTLEELQAEDEQADEQPAETPYPELLTDMQAYNQQLYETGQSGLVDAWSYEQQAFDLSQYGLSSDVVGTLSIPAMEEELPIYLGATQDNMSKGVVVLGQTSMPIGGENTNCVIAGHRGYDGIPFFREIERLQVGDSVYLTNFWGVLEYQVKSTEVIVPDNVEAVLIQPGKSMLTLVTCHPYPENTYRYVVYCEAVDSPEAETVPGQQEIQPIFSLDQQEQMSRQSRVLMLVQRWLPIAAIPLLLIVCGLLYSIYKKMNDKIQH